MKIKYKIVVITFLLLSVNFDIFIGQYTMSYTNLITCIRYKISPVFIGTIDNHIIYLKKLKEELNGTKKLSKSETIVGKRCMERAEV